MVDLLYFANVIQMAGLLWIALLLFAENHLRPCLQDRIATLEQECEALDEVIFEERLGNEWPLFFLRSITYYGLDAKGRLKGHIDGLKRIIRG